MSTQCAGPAGTFTPEINPVGVPADAPPTGCPSSQAMQEEAASPSAAPTVRPGADATLVPAAELVAVVGCSDFARGVPTRNDPLG